MNGGLSSAEFLFQGYKTPSNTISSGGDNQNKTPESIFLAIAEFELPSVKSDQLRSMCSPTGEFR